MDMAYDSGKNLFSSLDFIFLIYKMSMGVLYSTHRVNVSIKGIYACKNNLKILSVMRQWSDTLFKDKNYNDFFKKIILQKGNKKQLTLKTYFLVKASMHTKTKRGLEQ